MCSFSIQEQIWLKDGENRKRFNLESNLTRALEGGLTITPSGGGEAYNAPQSISAPMRASATNFGGYLGPY